MPTDTFFYYLGYRSTGATPRFSIGVLQKERVEGLGGALGTPRGEAVSPSSHFSLDLKVFYLYMYRYKFQKGVYMK